MATVTIDLEPGEIITVTVTSDECFHIDPDPGEEAPEDEERQFPRAVGE